MLCFLLVLWLVCFAVSFDSGFGRVGLVGQGVGSHSFLGVVDNCDIHHAGAKHKHMQSIWL